MNQINLSELSAEDLKAELKRRDELLSENRKAYKELVNENVPILVDKLEKLSIEISKTKQEIYQGLNNTLKLKFEIYGVKETQQSHTFSDEKGNSITIGTRVIDGWDDTVNTGIEKVNGFIKSLAKDEESAKLVQAINQLLKKDAKGNLKASRVIELQSMAENFNNSEFSDGVNIIRQSYKPMKSAFFVEAIKIDNRGEKVSIPLSISSVDFLSDMDIEFITKK